MFPARTIKRHRELRTWLNGHGLLVWCACGAHLDAAAHVPPLLFENIHCMPWMLGVAQCMLNSSHGTCDTRRKARAGHAMHIASAMCRPHCLLLSVDRVLGVQVPGHPSSPLFDKLCSERDLRTSGFRKEECEPPEGCRCPPSIPDTLSDERPSLAHTKSCRYRSRSVSGVQSSRDRSQSVDRSNSKLQQWNSPQPEAHHAIREIPPDKRFRGHSCDTARRRVSGKRPC